ncbi:hypothetical protein TWF730_005849 [Orbilia blumenaviensis]|uniref:Uncharacterized protein n=1 Tax=Orbilia blumenaviensis TaxID=1796055 RepID=A0AAV9VJL1_9PEZI
MDEYAVSKPSDPGSWKRVGNSGVLLWSAHKSIAYHPYFLSAVIIFNNLDCPPPDTPGLRWHYLPLENLDESELPAHRRPKWLQNPNAKYNFETNLGNDEASVDFPEHWEDMPKITVPNEFEKEPYWIDYSDSEAYSIDSEKRRVGVSKFKGDEYLNQLAKSMENGQKGDMTEGPQSNLQDYWYRDDMDPVDLESDDGVANNIYINGPDNLISGTGDQRERSKSPLWNVYDVSKDEPPFLGNISVIFVPDYKYTHVLGLAREFDEYARIGERVGGWGVPDFAISGAGPGIEMDDEGLTEMGSPARELGARD